MIKPLNSLKHDEGGATAIEYGLIASLIAIALVQGMELVGGNLAETFSTASSSLENSGSPTGALPEPAPGDPAPLPPEP